MSLCCSSGVTIYEDDLEYAVQQGTIDSKQATTLWPQFQQRSDDRWRLGWVHLAYFFGGSLILGSMTWLTNQAWQNAQGLSLFWLANLYVAVFGYGGYYVWNRNAPAEIPQVVGGIFTIVSVFISPVSAYALQRYFNYWPNNVPGIFEFTTLIIAGGVSIYFVNFPLLSLPLTIGLFSISEIDIPKLLWTQPTVEEYSWVSVIFGLITIIVSDLLDKYQKKKQSGQDWAFWSYIYGVLALCAGLNDLRYVVFDNSEAFKWIYLISNIAICSGTVIFQRNVFLVFGGLGLSSSVIDFLFTEATVTENAWISISFGSILTAFGIYTQQKSASSPFPFWSYLFGSSIFFGGLCTLFGYPIYDGQLFKFIFFLINVGLCLLSLYTQYRIFLFYGVIGGLWYIEEIVNIYYWNSYWLPLILTAIGLAIIALAVYFSHQQWKKRQHLSLQQEYEMQLTLQQQYEMQLTLQRQYEMQFTSGAPMYPVKV